MHDIRTMQRFLKTFNLAKTAREIGSTNPTLIKIKNGQHETVQYGTLKRLSDYMDKVFGEVKE